MFKKTIIAMTLFVAVMATAAEYSPPSSRLPATGTWAAAGVPGGIPTRETIYTTITADADPSTNMVSAINTALTNCPEGQVVLLGPGTFRVNTPINLSWEDRNVTLRGSTNADGSPATIIDARGQKGVTIGAGAEFNSPTTTGTVATFTKGATTLTVASSTGFSNGQLIQIRAADDPSIPVFHTQFYSKRRGQLAKIADSDGVPNSTTIVIDSPGLHGDFSGASAVYVEGSGFKATGHGIENLHITGVNSGSTMIYGIEFNNAYGCYVYNVKSEEAADTPLQISSSYRCEIRRFWGGATDGSTSSYGQLVQQSSSILTIDSVFVNSTFGTYQQIVCSGNVYAYNCIVKLGGTSTSNTNHGPWSQFTLHEGNVASSYQNDGYFGGAGYGMVFRNWFMGNALNVGTPGSAWTQNRLSRYETFLGNVFGRTGVGGGDPSFGNPNFGNGLSDGTSSFFGALSTLTTRTSATAGTITAPSGHGITTGATIDVYWREFVDIYQVSRVRRGVTVGTVSGTSIPISGGAGHDLPAQDEEIYVPTSNTAIVDYPLDWDSTLSTIRQSTGELTTRTSDTAGVITLDTGLGAALAAGLAVSYPVNTCTIRFNGDNGNINFATVSSVVGDVVTISDTSSALPALSTAVTIVPGPPGFQELDMDVIYTTLAKANYQGLPSGSGIPAVESLSGDTLANSMFLSSTPDFFTVAGLSWPPIDSSSPIENTYELIPAGKAYNDGWWGGASAPSYAPGRLRILRR